MAKFLWFPGPLANLDRASSFISMGTFADKSLVRPGLALWQVSFILVLLFLQVASCAPPAPSPPWSQQAVLPPLVTNSTEGYSVAISADGYTVAVGSPFLTTHGPSSGFVQVYVRSKSSWLLQATLSQGILNSHEGISVALSADGNTLVSGAPFFCR